MNLRKENTTRPVDLADSRAKKVAESILQDLGKLTVEHKGSCDDDDQPGDCARAVLKAFKKGVAAAVAKIDSEDETK